MSTSIEESIATLLDRVGWELHRRGRRAGLKTGEWLLLRYLATAEPEAATPKEFEYFHAVDPVSAALYVGGLERDGYIRRVPFERDRRTFQMEITIKGRKALERDPLLSLAGAVDARFESAALREQAIALLKLLHSFVDAGFRASAEEKRQAFLKLEESVERDALSAGAHGGSDSTTRAGVASKPAKQARAVTELLAEATGDIFKAGSTEELNRNGWFCLRYFARSDQDEATIATLVRDTGVNRKIASHSTHLLEALGCLKREKAQLHHEAFAVSLTTKGRRLLKEDPLKRLSDLLAKTFEKQELRQLHDLLECVLDAGIAKIENL